MILIDMAKGVNTNKTAVRPTANNKPNGRPKPMVPKAGYTQSRRRYGSGGKASN